MPVGTNATVKALDPADLREAGATIILSNTYHLYLRPGHERIAALGGLHRFMAWDRPILTDSGEFQVVSMGELRKIDDDGVAFQCHLDGSLPPLHAGAVYARAGGARLGHPVAFDQPVPPASSTRETVAAPMERTPRWAAALSATTENRTRPCSGSSREAYDPDLRAAVDCLHDEPALRRHLHRWPGRRRDSFAARSGAGRGRGAAAADPGPRYLMGLGRPRTCWRPFTAASICSTRSCPRAWPERWLWIRRAAWTCATPVRGRPATRPGGLSLPPLPPVLAGLPGPSVPREELPGLPARNLCAT